MRFVPSFLALPLLFALAACGGDPGGAGAEGAAGLDGPDRILEWEAEELYAVGGFDAPDWATFGVVDRVAFDEQGRLFIMDGQTATVTVVSPAGEFLRTIGGQGDGPGEIGNAFGMAVLPDGRVAIPDFGKRGIVLYDADGEWLTNVRVDLEEEGLPGADVTAHPAGMLLSSSPLRIIMSGEGDVNMTIGGGGDGRPVYLYAMDDSSQSRQIATAWEPPPPPEENASTLEGGSSGNMMAIRLSQLVGFEPQVHVAVVPDGRVALVDSTTYRIELHRPDGTPAGVLERGIPPTEVTDRIREMERDRQFAELEEAGGGRVRIVGGGGGASFDEAAMSRMMRERVENMSFYPEIPAIEEMAADWEGRIWVQRSSGTPGEPGPTDLVTADGGYVGTLPPDGIRIPEAFGPGGLMAVRELDEFDVATIRVFRVPTGEGDG